MLQQRGELDGIAVVCTAVVTFACFSLVARACVYVCVCVLCQVWFVALTFAYVYVLVLLATGGTLEALTKAAAHLKRGGGDSAAALEDPFAAARDAFQAQEAEQAYMEGLSGDAMALYMEGRQRVRRLPLSRWEALAVLAGCKRFVLSALLPLFPILDAVPLLISSVTDLGLANGLYLVMSSFVTKGAPLFFIFQFGTKAYHFMNVLCYGNAGYIATGRGFVIEHEPFVQLFSHFFYSHLGPGVELGVVLALYCAASRWLVITMKNTVCVSIVGDTRHASLRSFLAQYFCSPLFASAIPPPPR